MKLRFLLLPISLFLFGCATTPHPNAEFVASVNFSKLGSFEYKQTLISGMDFYRSDKTLLEAVSEATVIEILGERGFTEVDSDSDFYVVTKWKKKVSSYPSHFHHIDGYHESFEQRNDPAYGFFARLNLRLEVYESESDRLFWMSELRDVFSAIELTEERSMRSLHKALKNFPERVYKDPSLPDLD